MMKLKASGGYSRQHGAGHERSVIFYCFMHGWANAFHRMIVPSSGMNDMKVLFESSDLRRSTL